MIKISKYLFTILLWTVCTQLYADDNNSGSKVFISPAEEAVQNRDVDPYDEGAYRKNNPTGGGESSR